MSDINFIQVPLEELFENRRGNSLYTKTYCNKHKGEYQVYTGTTIGNFGFISTYEYDDANLTYTTDGEYAGSVKILTGKYNIGGHRALLKAKNNNLNLEYFSFVLEPIFKSITKDGSVPSITWSIMKDKLISVPVNMNGEYDFEAQKRIADKYSILEKQKNKLIKYKEQLEKTLIEADLSDKYLHKEIKISDLFTPKNGGMKYTKDYCNNHKGKYPIYSGNTRTEFAFIDSYDYDGKYITWCIDGLAGYIKVFNGKFSITNHRGILIPKNSKQVENINLEYLKYAIEPIFRKNIKGRMGHDGKNEYTSLKLNAVNKIEQKVSIPVNEDGSFNLQAQEEIANRYKKIEEVKKGICNKLNELINIEVLI